jgi:subtilase family serine protease
MQGLLKTMGQSFLTHLVSSAQPRRGLEVLVPGVLGVVMILLLTSNAVLAGVTTVELSQLVYKSVLIAPLDGNQQIGVVLALPSADLAGLADFVKQVSTPGDPLFHQYITPEQFAQRFGGNDEDYTALKNWAAANGLRVSQESVGRISLTVRGSVSQFQTLFKTQLNNYRAPDGQTFYSASVMPTVPVEIASKVSGVVGLTAGKPRASTAKVVKTLGEDPQVKSDMIRTDTAGGTGPGGTYSCTDLRTVYTTPTWGHLEKGMVVAVFEQGYYNPKDVIRYFDKFNIGKNTKQTPIAVDGSPIIQQPLVEAEACLDLDMFVGMNPDIAEVQVYIDDFTHDPFPVGIIDAFTVIAQTETLPQIVSVSYFEDEGIFGHHGEKAEDTTLQQLAAEGVSVFAASGDNGAFGDFYRVPYNTADPASDPYVTGVGGTTLFTGPGEVYLSETAWNELPRRFGATGGGIRSFWPVPDYQIDTLLGKVYLTRNGGSATMRNVPDVAAVGDPLTGVGIYVKDQGGWLQVGGTSVSCPLWSGYVSNINAAFSYTGMGNLGFFNPILYAVGGSGGVPSDYLYDIIQGSNGDVFDYGYPGYSNGLGYSNTTGTGSLWGNGFAIQLLISGTQAGSPPSAFTVTSIKTTKDSGTIKWTSSSGASGYAIGLYHRGKVGYYIAKAYVVSLKTTAFTLAHLGAGIKYYAYVYAFNASGAFTPGGYPIKIEK